MEALIKSLTVMKRMRMGRRQRPVKTLDTIAGGRFSGSRNICCNIYVPHFRGKLTWKNLDPWRKTDWNTLDLVIYIKEPRIISVFKHKWKPGLGFVETSKWHVNRHVYIYFIQENALGTLISGLALYLYWSSFLVALPSGNVKSTSACGQNKVLSTGQQWFEKTNSHSHGSNRCICTRYLTLCNWRFLKRVSWQFIKKKGIQHLPESMRRDFLQRRLRRSDPYCICRSCIQNQLHFRRHPTIFLKNVFTPINTFAIVFFFCEQAQILYFWYYHFSKLITHQIKLVRVWCVRFRDEDDLLLCFYVRQANEGLMRSHHLPGRTIPQLELHRHLLLMIRLQHVRSLVWMLQSGKNKF